MLTTNNTTTKTKHISTCTASTSDQEKFQQLVIDKSDENTTIFKSDFSAILHSSKITVWPKNTILVINIINDNLKTNNIMCIEQRNGNKTGPREAGRKQPAGEQPVRDLDAVTVVLIDMMISSKNNEIALRTASVIILMKETL